MATTRYSDVDEFGFKRPENFDYKQYEEFSSIYFTILTRRAIRWQKFMQKRNFLLEKSNTLKRFIRKGVPGNLRQEVWMKTSNAFKNQQKLPNLYNDLLKSQYNQETVNTIKVDLPRTYPDNIYFDQYKSRLFNILIAYSQHNPVVGYCQGLNYIAGLILLVTKNEEATFWLLREIIENIVPEYHTKTMKGLIRDINVLAELVKRRVPELNTKVEELGLPWQVISTKWFICLFAEVLPVETVLRIWDVMFYEGYKILFRVSLNLLLKHKDEILQCDDISNLAQLFRNISSSIKVINCHEFIESMFKISLTRRELERIRTECSSE